MKAILAFFARLFGRKPNSQVLPVRRLVPRQPGAERFYQEWAAGTLPLPYVCCTACQLYAAFLRWSHLNGERFPCTQTEFGGIVERTAAGNVRRKVVTHTLGTVEKRRTVYLVGPAPENESIYVWVDGGTASFEAALKAYRHVYDSVPDTKQPSLAPNIPSAPAPTATLFCKDCSHFTTKAGEFYPLCTEASILDVVTANPRPCKLIRQKNWPCGPEASLFIARTTEVAPSDENAEYIARVMAWCQLPEITAWLSRPLFGADEAKPSDSALPPFPSRAVPASSAHLNRTAGFRSTTS